MTLVMTQAILPQSDTKKPPKPTPVQLSLQAPLKFKDGLLLCREGKRETVLEMVFDSGLGEMFDVEEVTKKLKSSHLNKYDVLMIHDNVKMSSSLVKRRHFAFPVPAKCTSAQFKQQAELVLKSTSFLIQGGRNFEIKVAQTESMSVKDAVKNVVQTVVNLSSLIIYASQTKHNRIHKVFLSTTKSMPLPIIEKADDDESEE